MVGQQVGKEDVVDSGLRWQPHQARERAGHGNHSHVGAGSAPLAPQQKRNTQGFVQDPGKRVGGIHGYRRQQRIDLLLAVRVDKRLLLGVQFFEVQDANIFPGKSRQQLLVPALVLFFDELVGLSRDEISFLLSGQGIRAGINESFFNALQQASHPHFKELIQVACGNGQELHALQQRIVLVGGFLQHTAVESQPGSFAIDVKRRIFNRTVHMRRYLADANRAM